MRLCSATFRIAHLEMLRIFGDNLASFGKLRAPRDAQVPDSTMSRGGFVSAFLHSIACLPRSFAQRSGHRSTMSRSAFLKTLAAPPWQGVEKRLTRNDSGFSFNTLDPKTGCIPSTSLPTGDVLLPFPPLLEGEGGATAPGEVWERQA
jgi:hypothetical protein